jgi:hypothetical protein
MTFEEPVHAVVVGIDASVALHRSHLVAWLSDARVRRADGD